MENLKEQIMSAISVLANFTTTTKSGNGIIFVFDCDNRRSEGDALDGRYNYHFEAEFEEDTFEDWADESEDLADKMILLLKYL